MQRHIPTYTAVLALRAIFPIAHLVQSYGDRERPLHDEPPSVLAEVEILDGSWDPPGVKPVQ